MRASRRQEMHRRTDRSPVVVVSSPGWQPATALIRHLGRDHEVQVVTPTASSGLQPLLSHVHTPCHLIGHDLGTVPAIQAALLDCRSLRSLTLINPTTFGLLRQLHDGESWDAASRVAGHVIALHAADAASLAVRTFVSFWFGRTAWWLLTPAQKRLLAIRLPDIVNALASIYKDAPHHHDLAGLPIPVHLICSRLTPPPSRRLAELMHRLIPLATLDLIERGNSAIGDNVGTWLIRHEPGEHSEAGQTAQHLAWSDAT